MPPVVLPVLIVCSFSLCIRNRLGVPPEFRIKRFDTLMTSLNKIRFESEEVFCPFFFLFLFFFQSKLFTHHPSTKSFLKGNKKK